MQKISISPVPGGWRLSCPAFGNDQFFRDGASAEASAIGLAHAFARMGAAATINVLLADGSVARRFATPRFPDRIEQPWQFEPIAA